MQEITILNTLVMSTCRANHQ